MAAFQIQVLLLCLFSNVFSLPANVIQTNNDTVKENDQATFNQCFLVWNDGNSRDKLHTILSGDAKLVEFTLHFDNESDTRNIFGFMFKPQEWSLTTGRHGMGLLMLQDNYKVLSLTTLSVGVEKLVISLRQSPAGCLWRTNASRVEQHIRTFLLSETASDTCNICNMQILKEGEQAAFAYMCCHRSPDGKTICNKLTTDKWINVLLVCIVIIKVLVVLYSPLLVSESWYRPKLMASAYVFNCNTPKQINVFKTKNPERYSNFKHSVKLSKFGEMPKFLKTLNGLELDTPYCIKTKTANLKVKSRRLVPENYVPVSVRRSVYHSLFMCKIRQKLSVKDCCESNIFDLFRPLLKSWPWYKCLREMMQGILFVFVAIPWILRVAIFFNYEEQEVNARKTAAESQDLQVPFHGNATLYLTPMHGVFLLVYFIILVDAIVFGVLRKHVQNRFKYVLRKCFRDMRERSRFETCGWAINTLLKPLQKFGIAGIVIGIPFWVVVVPVCSIVMAFYLFPTLNLSIRLVAHFVSYLIPEVTHCTKNRIFKRMREMAEDKLNFQTISNQESLERSEATSIKGRLLQLLVITMCLISLYSVTFLLMELISFLVEMGIYTMMGVILNAGKTMRFVTLLLLLVFYGNDCFQSVNKKYLDFNKVINAAICVKAGEQLKNTALQHEDIQKNSAFYIEAENVTDEEEIVQFTVKDNVPKWRARGLIMFLDQQDVPYIPEKFFFDTCNLPHFRCPGALYLNLIKAMSQFMIIVLFLLFVVVVVLAFGDVYRISTTNQMLATLAGGFLPWIFRNVLFKAPTGFSLDTSNLNFQGHFNETIKNFQQSWPIYDIVSDEITRRQEGIELDVIKTDLSDNVVSAETEPMIKPGGPPNSTPRDDGGITDKKIDLMVILPNDTSAIEMNGSISMLADSEIEWDYRSPLPDIERSPHIINV